MNSAIAVDGSPGTDPGSGNLEKAATVGVFALAGLLLLFAALRLLSRRHPHARHDVDVRR
jgi:hypothetical protein